MNEILEILFWAVADIFIIIGIIVILASVPILLADDFPEKFEALDPNKMKTGDILVVGYTHFVGWMMTLFSWSLWSHTAVVWRDPVTKELFVCEAAMYGGKWNNLFKIPFIDWYRINKNYRLSLVPLNKELNPTLYNEIWCGMIENFTLDGFNRHWSRLLQMNPYTNSFKKNNKLTCYELTILSLQKSGVIQKRYMPGSYFPRDIVFGRLDMSEGYKYEKSIMLDDKYFKQIIYAQ